MFVGGGGVLCGIVAAEAETAGGREEVVSLADGALGAGGAKNKFKTNIKIFI